MLSKENAEKLRLSRIGMENINKQGLHMKIVEYYGVRKVDVLFDDGFIKTTDYKSFIRGSVFNDKDSRVHGVGITYGKYRKRDEPRIYRAWAGMIERCYSKKFKERCPTYEDVSCCEEWLYFEKFCDWVLSQENYKNLQNELWAIDKDILSKGNKIYSPETSCIVPQHVNTLFLKRGNDRGKYPIGVFINKGAKQKKYRACCNNPFTKGRFVSDFYTVEDAFAYYKEKKEWVIQEMAMIEFAKGTISRKCYEAMMNYQVEITD